MYDPKCLELAQHFLPDEAPETAELAQWIQDQIELWFSGTINQSEVRQDDGGDE